MVLSNVLPESVRCISIDGESGGHLLECADELKGTVQLKTGTVRSRLKWVAILSSCAKGIHDTEENPHSPPKKNATPIMSSTNTAASRIRRASAEAARHSPVAKMTQQQAALSSSRRLSYWLKRQVPGRLSRQLRVRSLVRETGSIVRSSPRLSELDAHPHPFEQNDIAESAPRSAYNYPNVGVFFVFLNVEFMS